jgi:hypothetical protein
MQRQLITVMVLCGAALLSSCDDSVTGPDPERAAAAEAALFTAMNHDDFAAAGDIIGEFYMIREVDPENYRNTFLLGSAALWWLAESARPGANALLITSQAIPLILETYVDVIQNDPVNRAGASALLGAFLSDGGFDRVQGSNLVEQAVVMRPEVGLFQRMHIRRFAFADDSITDESIEAGFDFWEYCAGTPIDRDNPDFTTLVRPPTEDLHKKFCWGSERVPHGYEGAMLIFGDLLVKDGQLAVARRVYENARLGPNYNRWKYKGALEQRLISDLSQRHDTYANRDQSKWAPIGLPPYSCTQCHASEYASEQRAPSRSQR